MNPIKDNIKNALDLSKLPLKEQEEIVLRVGALIYQNVLMRVVPQMNDAQVDEFEKLLDTNAAPEEIFSFLKNSVQDFEKIIEEEATKFKDKASNIMSQIG